MNAANARKQEPGWFALLGQPAARQYLFLALAALAVYCILMSGRTRGPGGNLGTLLTLIITIPGLIGRWAISPALFLILTTYLAIDPNFESWLWGIRRGSGRAGPIENLMLAACILVYLMAQFRLHSLLHKSRPDDPPPRPPAQPEPAPRRRPASTVADRELSVLLVVALGSILAGCVGWLLLSEIESVQRLGGDWGIKRPFAALDAVLLELHVGFDAESCLFPASRHAAHEPDRSEPAVARAGLG